MILVDSNIFMYAAGADHPNKRSSADLVERIARGEVDAAIDVEVLQEILHRYRAIHRWEEGRLVYDLVRTVVPVVLDVSVETLDQARKLMDQHADLSARDAVHAATCLQHQLGAICTFDRDFDAIDGLRRVEPSAI